MGAEVIRVTAPSSDTQFGIAHIDLFSGHIGRECGFLEVDETVKRITSPHDGNVAPLIQRQGIGHNKIIPSVIHGAEYTDFAIITVVRE